MKLRACNHPQAFLSSGSQQSSSLGGRGESRTLGRCIEFRIREPTMRPRFDSFLTGDVRQHNTRLSAVILSIMDGLKGVDDYMEIGQIQSIN